VLGTLLLAAARRVTGDLNVVTVLRAIPAAVAMSVVAELFVRIGAIAPAIVGGALSYGVLLLVLRPLSRVELQDAWRLLSRQEVGG